MAKKIRITDPDEGKILEECKADKLVGCNKVLWTTPINNVQTEPPLETVAIIVDIRNNHGAIFIHETEGGNYIDGVGTEEAGKLVIVPWNPGWHYYSIGTIRVGHITGG